MNYTLKKKSTMSFHTNLSDDSFNIMIVVPPAPPSPKIPKINTKKVSNKHKK